MHAENLLCLQCMLRPCCAAQAILPKHKLNDEEIEKLLGWKHGDT